GQSLREAYGPFDWFTTADIEHNSKTNPVSSQSQASASRNTFVDLGVSQLLPTGGTYSLNLNNNRPVQTGGLTTVSPAFGPPASLDIRQPRVQIATTEEALIAAVAAVRDAEDQLRALLNLPQDEWDRPIVPTETVTYTPMNVDVASSLARAFDLRPELRET